MSTTDRSKVKLSGVPGERFISGDVVWLDTTEAAEYSRLKPNTLRQYRCMGIGPVFHKVGSKVLYRLSDLNDYLSKGRVA